MAREQIRIRVDGKLWESLKRDGESNTELSDRILSDWLEQRQVLAALSTIDLSPSQAIGKLMLSHDLIARASITIQAAQDTQFPQVESKLIGGLENNSDDW